MGQQLDFVYDRLVITLGTLAVLTAIGGAGKIDASRENGFRIMKTEAWMTFGGMTAGEGPLIVGFACNATVSQVESTIEVDDQSSTDSQLSGVSRRPVWPMWMIGLGLTTEAQEMYRIINPKWSVPEGEAAVWWVYNADSTNALTTGGQVNIFAKHSGVWLRD